MKISFRSPVSFRLSGVSVRVSFATNRNFVEICDGRNRNFGNGLLERGLSPRSANVVAPSPPGRRTDAFSCGTQSLLRVRKARFVPGSFPVRSRLFRRSSAGFVSSRTSTARRGLLPYESSVPSSRLPSTFIWETSASALRFVALFRRFSSKLYCVI